MAEIKTYDTIVNYAEDGKAALARQVWDETQQQFQNQINEKAEASLQGITQQQFNAIFD